MKQSFTSVPGQTHFIGVPAPEDLARFLSTCRTWMGSKYGCKSGFRTPFHVTLAPPFSLTDGESIRALARSLEAYSSGAESFMSRVCGFGSFGEKTVFARVIPDQRWDSLRDGLYAAIAQALPGVLKKDARQFTPHLTVANRDIPPGAVAHALQYLGDFGLDEGFAVDRLALFERRGGIWEIADCIPFSPFSR